MAIAIDQVEQIRQLRDQYGDEATLRAMIQTHNMDAGYWEQKIKEQGAKSAMSDFLGDIDTPGTPVTPTEPEEPELAFSLGALARFPGQAVRAVGGFAKRGLEATGEAELRVAEAYRETPEGLRKLGVETTQPLAGKVQAAVRGAPSVERIKAMLDQPDPEKLRELGMLSIEGLMATPEQLGEEYAEKAKRLYPDLVTPEASRVRAGREMEFVPRAWAAEHPYVAFVPYCTEWLLEELWIKPYLLYPERAPAEMVAELAGAIVVGKAAKGARKLLAKVGKKHGIAQKPIGKALRSFLKRKNVTLTKSAWDDFVREGVQRRGFTHSVGEELLALNDDQVAHMAKEMAKFPDADVVTVMMPRRKAGMPKVKEVIGHIPGKAVAEAAGAPYHSQTSIDNIVEVERIIQERGQKGFLRVVGAKRGPSARQKMTAVSKEIGRPDAADDFYIWRDQNAAVRKLGVRLSNLYDQSRELIRGRMDAKLLDTFDPKRSVYPDPIRSKGRQFVDNLRTKLTPMGLREHAGAQADLYGIWGDLTDNQTEELVNLLFARSSEVRSAMGQRVMSGLSPDEAHQRFIKLWRDADEPIRAGYDRYERFMREFVLDQLVRRGKINIDDVYDFYAPHKVIEHLYRNMMDDFRLPKKLRPRFRGYLKKATGTESPIAVDREVFENYVSIVRADNALDDFATKELSEMDALVRKAAIDDFGEEEAKAIFKKLRPNQRVIIDGNTYVSTQYEPGRHMFKATVADVDKIALSIEDALLHPESEINKIFRLPADEQVDALLSFTQGIGPRGGDALRQGIMLGGWKKQYLVPEEMASRLANLRGKGDYIPLLYDLMGLTSQWKKITLGAAGLPYQTLNLFGDTVNLSLTAPKAVFEIPHALRIIHYMRNPHLLDDLDREALEIVFDQDIFGAGFFRELGAVTEMARLPAGAAKRPSGLRPLPGPHKLKSIMKWYEHESVLREGLNRVALVRHNLRRAKAGLPLEGIQFARELDGLTTKQAIGYIARHAMVDYGDVPKWHSKFVRNLLFPFITFSQKNTQNFVKLMGTMPRMDTGRPARFVAEIIAPIAAIQAWNRGLGPDVPGVISGERRRAIYEKLGPFQRRFYTTIIAGYDDDGDGIDDRALIWSPRTPIDEAGEWFGIDELLQRIVKVESQLASLNSAVRSGRLTKEQASKQRKRVLIEAARDQLMDTVTAPAGQLEELQTPMVQIIEGIIANRDPYTKQKIVQDPTLPKYYHMKEYAEFALGKMLTAYGTFAKTRAKGKAPSIGPAWMPEFARRIAGTFAKGPFDWKRAFGFYEVDLVGAQAREIKNVTRERETLRRMYTRKILNEYTGSPVNPRQFVQGIAADVGQADMNPDYKPSASARVVLDAKRKGVDLRTDIADGTLLKKLTEPTVLMDILRERERRGTVRDPVTGAMRRLSKNEKRDLKLVISKVMKMMAIEAAVPEKEYRMDPQTLSEVMRILGLE